MPAESSLPEPDAARVSGASLIDATVMVPVAGLLSSRPWLSTEAYWKSVVPFQLAFGTKVIEAALAEAGTSAPMASATPLSSSVPLAGKVLITKWSTVPSISEPLSATGMPAESSLPEPDAARVSGASLTDATVMVPVAGLLSSRPSLSTEA
ncbi:hypothetical protein D3C85_1279940 [compost metagenome]